jgi:hypothetical protein
VRVVLFTPGARSAWHRHPAGQVLHQSTHSGYARYPKALRSRLTGVNPRRGCVPAEAACEILHKALRGNAHADATAGQPAPPWPGSLITARDLRAALSPCRIFCVWVVGIACQHLHADRPVMAVIVSTRAGTGCPTLLLVIVRKHPGRHTHSCTASTYSRAADRANPTRYPCRSALLYGSLRSYCGRRNSGQSERSGRTGVSLTDAPHAEP